MIKAGKHQNPQNLFIATKLFKMFGDKTINHKKVKELGIKAERIRELINGIEEQQSVLKEVRGYGKNVI